MIKGLLARLFSAKPKDAIETKEDKAECDHHVWHDFGEYVCGHRSKVAGKRWVLFCKTCKKQGNKNHRWCD